MNRPQGHILTRLFLPISLFAAVIDNGYFDYLHQPIDRKVIPVIACSQQNLFLVTVIGMAYFVIGTCRRKVASAVPLIPHEIIFFWSGDRIGVLRIINE